MIEVEAEILRGSCMPVYFVGETIECLVRFKCLPTPNINTSSSSSSVNKQRGSVLSSASSSDVTGSGGGGGGLSTTSSQSTITSNISSTPAATAAAAAAAAATKVKYVDLAETASMCSANFDEKKLNEINQSMFSLLATYPSTSSMSNTSSSIPSTPTESSFFPGIGKQSRSLYSMLLSNNNNTDQQQQTAGIENEEAESIIAWSCVQLDCNCFIDEAKVALPKIPMRYNIYNDTEASSNTSFQPNRDRHGLSVYSSKPKILFCNLCLRPNEEKTFLYRETLPYDLAPSFRGQFARYTYKLTVGVQKLNRNTQLLRLPFKVYSLLDFEKFIPKLNDAENGYVKNSNKRESILTTEVSDTSIEVGEEEAAKERRNNPFKVVEKSQFESLEYALQILEDLTSRLNTTHYNVANEDGKIVKITLGKTNYKIGDKIVVLLDFTDAQVPCVEFKVTLQSEEVISEECRKKSNQVLSSIISHAELQEHTLFMKKTNFTMQIPVQLTPTFVSDIISLRWRLHFDFALTKTPIQKIYRSNDPVMSLSWRPPSALLVNVMSWDLPIILHPFDPFLAADLIIPTSNENYKLTIN